MAQGNSQILENRILVTALQGPAKCKEQSSERTSQVQGPKCTEQ